MSSILVAKVDYTCDKVCHNYLKNCDNILARCKDYRRIIVENKQQRNE